MKNARDMQYANIITGGIGCGKSTVSKLLSLKGFCIVDADVISHEILNKNVATIKANFGAEIIENGVVNRSKLGSIIFNHQAKKELLESLLHPLIYQRIIEQCCILETKKKPYFIELPLYFESKFDYKARFVVCVYAPQDTQLQRIMKRNNLDADSALKRIHSQMDIEIKRAKSDFVINNTADLQVLQHNVAMFLQDFMTYFV